MLGCQATAARLPVCAQPPHSSGLLSQSQRIPTNLLLGKIIVTFGNTITLLFSEDKLRCFFDPRDVLIHYSPHGANEKAIIN